MLGDLSYLVYLFHLPAIALVLYGGRYPHLGTKGRLLYLAAVWVGSFAVSFLFWLFVHLPLDKWRRRFIVPQEAKVNVPAQALYCDAVLSGSGSD